MGISKASIRKHLGKSKTLRRAYAAGRKGLAIIRPVGGNTPISYEQWIRHNEPRLWVSPKEFAYQPTISIIVPAYNTPDKYLLPLIESVRAQLYSKWQLCVADGSPDKARASAIAAACAVDERIVYKRLGKNHGIVGNTNEAINIATGEFIAFLDHDDTLSPHALLEVVAALDTKPDADVLFSDEDKISDDGRRRSLPFFKPDWSPTLLEGVNYLTHFFVVKRSVVEAVGALKPGFDGSQDYEFILRVTDHTKRIVHIPKILYHWRIADGSTAGEIGNKSYATTAGERALAEHVKRIGAHADVRGIPDAPTNYRLHYRIPKGAKASIIIPFKDKVSYLKTLVPSILEKTTYKNYELLLISNNSVEPETHEYLATLANTPKIRLLEWNHPFNYSAVNNYGRSQAKGDYIVLLNNDTEVITGDWLEELLGVASQPWAGAVGPELFYPDGRIQHAGVILGMKGMAGHVFRLQPADATSPFGRPLWPRDYLAVTAACLAVKATKYDEVGGLDEKFVVAGNDVAFCLSLYEKGYRNVYWPFAQLYHYESVSVGSYEGLIGDYNHSLTYYRPYLDWHDPYFSTNLSLQSEQIALRSTYE